MSDESPTALEELKSLGQTVDGQFKEIQEQLVQLQGDYDAQAKVLSTLQKRLIESNEPKASGFHKWFGLACLAAGKQAFGREGRAMDMLKASFEYDEKAMSEGTDTAGGYTVPTEFAAQLIRLVESYGVFRRNARIWPMASDKTTMPKRTGGVTVYFPGEGGSITASDITFTDLTLAAKKMATLTAISTELDEDSAIAIGALLADEIALGFATKEDNMAFEGDGTSTYANVQGFRAKLLGLSATRANIAGLHVATTNTKTAWSNVSVNDMATVQSLAPRYALEDPTCAWYCSQNFWGSVMSRLALAGGGNTAPIIHNGKPTFMFLGYPVNITQVMPTAPVTDQVICLFGSVRQAAVLGERRSIDVASDRSVYFATDQIAIRGTQRVDVVIHEVGNATATEADKVRGPVVGLLADA